MKFSSPSTKTKSVPMGRFSFSDNPCFNFAKHKCILNIYYESVCGNQNRFAAIPSDFLANKHYIIVCKDKVLIHSFDVVHIHKGSSGGTAENTEPSVPAQSRRAFYIVMYVFCPA